MGRMWCGQAEVMKTARQFSRIAAAVVGWTVVVMAANDAGFQNC